MSRLSLVWEILNILPFLVSLHPSRAAQSLLLLCWGTPLKAKQSCVRKNTARCEEMPRLAGNSRVRLLSAQSQAQMSSPKVFLSSYTSMCFISPSFPSRLQICIQNPVSLRNYYSAVIKTSSFWWGKAASCTVSWWIWCINVFQLLTGKVNGILPVYGSHFCSLQGCCLNS